MQSGYAAIIGLLLSGETIALRADSYPSRPIRMVVPFAAGGGTDVTARRIGQKITLVLG